MKMPLILLSILFLNSTAMASSGTCIAFIDSDLHQVATTEWSKTTKTRRDHAQTILAAIEAKGYTLMPAPFLHSRGQISFVPENKSFESTLKQQPLLLSRSSSNVRPVGDIDRMNSDQRLNLSRIGACEFDDVLQKSVCPTAEVGSVSMGRIVGYNLFIGTPLDMDMTKFKTNKKAIAELAEQLPDCH